MDTAALLSNPIISTLSPVEVFHMLKRAEATERLRQRMGDDKRLPGFDSSTDPSFYLAVAARPSMPR